MIGLAVLTKGPVAVLLFGLTVGVYWMINRFRLKINIWEILVYVLVMGFVGGIWFIIQIMIGNEKIISDFITYQIRLLRTQDAGHGGFFLYHIVILLFGVFPASIFALKGFRRSYYDESPQKRFKYWMIMLFLVVLVVFSIVKTKIVHYSSLCYFPLTYLGAYVVSKIIRNRIRNFLWLNWVYGVIGTLYASMSIALPLLLINKDWIIREGWIKDEFALGNLQADVHWSGWESAIGFLFLVGIILSLLMVRKRKNYGYSMLFLNTTLYTLLSILFITPRIEGYSQNALIEFCKERQDEECYVETLGMKSYAHYFYTNREPPENEKANDADWLLKGDIDKTAYFILRNRSVKRYMEQYPDLKEYYSKNGFAFLIREPEQDNIKENSDDQ